MLTPKERVETALLGDKPDRVPTAVIYDFGYLAKCTGHDPREFVAAAAAKRIEMVEAGFRRHEVDCYFVHTGTTDAFVNNHSIEKLDNGYWMVTHRETGNQYRLRPDGWHDHADGSVIPRAPSSGGVSRIQSCEDIDARVGAPPTAEQIEATGRFGTMRRLVAKYPDHHFSFQSGSPMPMALGACGGYVEALITLASDRSLFREILRRCHLSNLAYMAPGKRAGAHSTWFTSYYTGADTISPKDYAELVFPYEYAVCQAAKDAGLFVLNWFLGDLMPILDQVMELPIDALVLEQGRKGYDIDPVAIRKRVGPRFCLFGFGFENDYCTFNRYRLAAELERQIRGAGQQGAFVAGTPIMPPNAMPEAVDFYLDEARRIGRY